MARRIFICGASARSAAQSASRCGFRVIGADLFGDLDLRACSVAIQSRDYPDDLRKIAQHLPPSDWMYTGGLENRPDLVQSIARRHRLLGNDAGILTRIRNPWQLARSLRDADLRFPETRRALDSSGGGIWLCKPLASCGGQGIHRVNSTPSPDGAPPHFNLGAAGRPATDGRSVGQFVAAVNVDRRGDFEQRPPWGDPRHDASATVVSHIDRQPNPPTVVYQALVPGQTCSAIFVAANGSAELLGVTRQLVGCDWTGAREFQYCGSLGASTLEAGQVAQWNRIGACLAGDFDLRGLFGVDGIVSGDGIWVIEVNPRFCASVEILERSLGFNAAAVHRDACLSGKLPAPTTTSEGELNGKAILFADRAMHINERLVEDWIGQNRNTDAPRLADLPRPGSAIQKGRPVLTVFAQGRTSDQVLDRLRVRMAQVRDQLQLVSGLEAACPE